jgi:hypothetical protein
MPLPKLPNLKIRIPALRLPKNLPGTRKQQFGGISLVVILLLAGFGIEVASGPNHGPQVPGGSVVLPPGVRWGADVDLHGEGYEPGLAADSTGALYYTAHKDQSDRSSYPYKASWFMVSTDNGETWASPTQPFPLGAKWQYYVGDEGDIAVDSRDYVYFVDTFLLDNHLHVWADQGVWQYSEHIQKTVGLDDRPWITAQGNGILHYLGNNGNEVNGGRYWYYRSANGGRTWTTGDPVPGNGWAELDAERNGDHVYVVDESEIDTEADIRVWISDDQGLSWDWANPVIIGHRNGTGSAYPLITTGDNGIVFALWNDITDGEANGTHIFVAKSTDYGATWNSSEITPFKMYSYYQSITVDSTGTLGVAFYGTPDVPVNANSTWWLYGAMLRNADITNFTGNTTFNFTKASPDNVFVGARVDALGDLFESAITPDGAYNIAYERRDVAAQKRWLFFVRGMLPD